MTEAIERRVKRHDEDLTVISESVAELLEEVKHQGQSLKLIHGRIGLMGGELDVIRAENAEHFAMIEATLATILRRLPPASDDTDN